MNILTCFLGIILTANVQHVNSLDINQGGTRWFIPAWVLAVFILVLLAVVCVWLTKSQPSIKTVVSTRSDPESISHIRPGASVLRPTGVSRGDYSSVRSVRKASSVFYNPPPKRYSLLECCPCARDVERRSLSTIASLDIADDEYEIVIEKLCVFKVPLSITALPEDLEDRPMRFGMPPTSQEVLTYKEELVGYEDYNSRNYHPSSGQTKLSSSMYPSYYAMVPKRQNNNYTDETPSSSKTKRVPVEKAEFWTYQRGGAQEITTSQRESNYQPSMAGPSTSHQSKVRINPLPSAQERFYDHAGNPGPAPYHEGIKQKVSFHPNEKQSQSEVFARYTTKAERMDAVNIPFNFSNRTSAYYAIVPSLSDCEEQEIRRNDDLLPPEHSWTTEHNKYFSKGPGEHISASLAKSGEKDVFAFSGTSTGFGSKQGNYRVSSKLTGENLDGQLGAYRCVGGIDESSPGTNQRDDFQHRDDKYKQSGSDNYGNTGSIDPNSIHGAPAVPSRREEEQQARRIPGPKRSAHEIQKPLGYRSSNRKKSQDELSYYDAVPKKVMPQKKISKVSIKQQQAKRYATYYVSSTGPSFKKVTSNTSKKQHAQTTPSPQQSNATTDGETSNQLPIHSTLSWLPSRSDEEYKLKDWRSALSLNENLNSETEVHQFRTDNGKESSAENTADLSTETTTYVTLSSNTNNMSGNVDNTTHNDTHHMSLSQHLANFGLRGLNTDPPIDSNQEKQTNFWDQFASVLIEHNLTDPIPKDPNTFPAGYRSINTGRLADHLSKFGSRQYSTNIQPAPTDNSPKRPRSADSDEVGKVYSPNAKRRPSFNVMESHKDSLEIETSNVNENSYHAPHNIKTSSRTQEPVAIRESAFSNEMGCAKLGDNDYYETQLPRSRTNITSHQYQSGNSVNLQGHPQEISNIELLTDMLPNSSASVPNTGDRPKNLPHSLPELNDYLYYTNLTKNSSTFEVLPSDSNNPNRVGIDLCVKDNNSLAFLAQPSSAFVMSPISSNMFDARNVDSSLPPQLGAQIEPVPSGYSDEISCIHLTESECNSRHNQNSAAQIESVSQDSSAMSHENEEVSFGRFTAPINAAPLACNSYGKRPSSAGEYSRPSTTHCQFNQLISVGSQPKHVVESHEQSTRHSSFVSERNEKLDELESYRQSGFLSRRKEFNSNDGLDEEIIKLPITLSSTPTRNCDAQQDLVFPRSPRRADKSSSHFLKEDESGAVQNTKQWRSEEHSALYDKISCLSPRMRTSDHVPCSPSPDERQPSPENQFRRNTSSSYSNRIEAQEHLKTPQCHNNIEDKEHDRRKMSFCMSLEPSNSQESDSDVDVLRSPEGAASLKRAVNLSRTSSPENRLGYPDGEPSENPVIDDDHGKSGLSEESSQGTLLWRIMIKHRKHTSSENLAKEQEAEEIDKQSCPLFTHEASQSEED